jgi:hypothetical protein
VTWNVSIAIRSLCVTLLAAILALVLVVTLAEDADARKVRRKKGIAEFSDTFHSTSQPFEPPDRFSCSPGRPVTVPTAADWDPPNIQPPKPIDGYICTAIGSVRAVPSRIAGLGPVTQAAIFDLNDVLFKVAPGLGLTPPPGQLATPDLIKCHLVPNAAGERLANDFSCEFPEKQQLCVFTMRELVATNIDEVDRGGGAPDLVDVDRKADGQPNDLFLPISCHALPSAVPAGADAAGEGLAAWLFGLVLAAGGAMVGTVVIARRRFLHDS